MAWFVIFRIWISGPSPGAVCPFLWIWRKAKTFPKEAPRRASVTESPGAGRDSG